MSLLVMGSGDRVHAASQMATQVSNIASESAPPSSVPDPSVELLSELDLSPEELEAGYRFALGKMLAEESKFEEALEAYERAVELAPEDAYGWIEIAKFNSYLAQISRTRQQQVTYLDGALTYIEQAKTLAPTNLDALELYAQTHMRLASERPSSSALAQGAFEQLNELDPGNLGTLTSLGQIYLWNREGEKAVGVLSEAARFNASNRVIQSMLVEALLGTGKTEDAEKALETLIPLEPGNSEHRLRLAELRSERGDHEGAVEVLAAAPKDDWLGGARILQLLAREYHLAGRHQEALTTLDEHAASQNASSQISVPEADGPRRLRAAILSALLRYEDAVEVFSPLVGDSGDGERDIQDAMLLSRLFERVGRWDEAVETLRGHVDSEEASPQAALAMAGVLERAGRGDEALSLLAGLETDPEPRTRAVAAQGRAEILSSLGRFDEASEALASTSQGLAELGAADLGKALRLRQAMLEAANERWQQALEVIDSLTLSEDSGLQSAVHQLRLDVLSGTGKVEEALELLEAEPDLLDTRQMIAKKADILFEGGRRDQAVALVHTLGEEEDLENIFFASQLFQRHEHYEAAAELLEKVVSLRPDNLQALFALGASQERSGLKNLSTETFLRLLDLSPAHAPTLNYLGYMWAEDGEKLEQALSMILRAVSQDPDNGAYVDSLGWAYYRLGRFEEALAHLEWASRLEPSDSTVFVHLGDAYVASGLGSQAQKAYQRALDLVSDTEQVSTIRGKIQQIDSLLSTPGT